MSANPDVVIVGGGIGGSALAAVLAKQGAEVLVLERQQTYKDRVRGEYMPPWGVEETQRLGLLDVLLGAGGHFCPRYIPYDELTAPEIAEQHPVDMGKVIPGIAGALMVSHPGACEALARAAAVAGATVLKGVTNVSVEPGARPKVRFSGAGTEQVVEPRLVVGADGRTSSVRAQAGIEETRFEPSHLITGLLVDGASDWPRDTYSIGTEDDRMYYVFPQGETRVRLYNCTALDQTDRFVGASGVRRFMESFKLRCLPGSQELAGATPIGPCATLTGEDTVVERPYADGVVLVGDAAGYNDPIMGQGLSLAMRDARMISEVMGAGSDWSPGAFQPYREERVLRMARMRFAAAMMAELRSRFGAEARERRARYRAKVAAGDTELGMVTAISGVGPDRVNPAWFTEVVWERALK